MSGVARGPEGEDLTARFNQVYEGQKQKISVEEPTLSSPQKEVFAKIAAWKDEQAEASLSGHEINTLGELEKLYSRPEPQQENIIYTGRLGQILAKDKALEAAGKQPMHTIDEAQLLNKLTRLRPEGEEVTWSKEEIKILAELEGKYATAETAVVVKTESSFIDGTPEHKLELALKSLVAKNQRSGPSDASRVNIAFPKGEIAEGDALSPTGDELGKMKDFDAGKKEASKEASELLNRIRENGGSKEFQLGLNENELQLLGYLGVPTKVLNEVIEARKEEQPQLRPLTTPAVTTSQLGEFEKLPDELIAKWREEESLTQQPPRDVALKTPSSSTITSTTTTSTPATKMESFIKLKEVATKIATFFKEMFSPSPKVPISVKVEASEDFLRGRYIKDGKLTPSTAFTEEDSKKFSKASGLGGGTLGVIGHGLRDAWRKNISGASEEMNAEFSKESLSRKTLEDKSAYIQGKFKKSEEALQPYLENPVYAAAYAHDLREHVGFLCNLELPRLALDHYNNRANPHPEFDARVNQKMQDGMKQMDAIRAVLDEPGGIEAAGLGDQLKEIRGLQEKAMLWARYAAEKGNPDGMLSVAELYFRFGNWSTPEHREATYDIAMRFAESAARFTFKHYRRQGQMAVGAINEKRMLLAAKQLEKDPGNEELKKEIGTYGLLAVQGYSEAGDLGNNGLFNLFKAGSEEAGNVLLARFEGKARFSGNDQKMLRALRDAGVDGVQEFAESKGLALNNITINASEDTIKAVVDEHNKLKANWALPSFPSEEDVGSVQKEPLSEEKLSELLGQTVHKSEQIEVTRIRALSQTEILEEIRQLEAEVPNEVERYQMSAISSEHLEGRLALREEHKQEVANGGSELDNLRNYRIILADLKDAYQGIGIYDRNAYFSDMQLLLQLQTYLETDEGQSLKGDVENAISFIEREFTGSVNKDDYSVDLGSFSERNPEWNADVHVEDANQRFNTFIEALGGTAANEPIGQLEVETGENRGEMAFPEEMTPPPPSEWQKQEFLVGREVGLQELDEEDLKETGVEPSQKELEELIQLEDWNPSEAIVLGGPNPSFTAPKESASSKSDTVEFFTREGEPLTDEPIKTGVGKRDVIEFEAPVRVELGTVHVPAREKKEEVNPELKQLMSIVAVLDQIPDKGRREFARRMLMTLIPSNQREGIADTVARLLRMEMTKEFNKGNAIWKLVESKPEAFRSIVLAELAKRLYALQQVGFDPAEEDQAFFEIVGGLDQWNPGS